MSERTEQVLGYLILNLLAAVFFAVLLTVLAGLQRLPKMPLGFLLKASSVLAFVSSTILAIWAYLERENS